VLTSADNDQSVTITVGQTVAVVIPHATSVFVADSTPDQPAVLNPVGSFRFRAVAAGQVVLAPLYNCGRGASCAWHWLSTVIVRAG
jgi:hypothetical protein